MRWLLDECIDAGLVEQLRLAGHDVLYVAEIAPRASDLEVMALAATEHRPLLTEDKDFGDLAVRRARSVPGILLLRIGTMRAEQKVERLMTAVDRFGDTLFGRYTVVEEGRFRSRSLRLGRRGAAPDV
jgi:predicted nuclease of predicted toxin-antitoxin system